MPPGIVKNITHGAIPAGLPQMAASAPSTSAKLTVRQTRRIDPVARGGDERRVKIDPGNLRFADAPGRPGLAPRARNQCRAMRAGAGSADPVRPARWLPAQAAVGPDLSAQARPRFACHSAPFVIGQLPCPDGPCRNGTDHPKRKPARRPARTCPRRPGFSGGQGRPPGVSMSSSRVRAVIISPARPSVRPRIAASRRSQTSGFSLR